jgi:hypothetical protein
MAAEKWKAPSNLVEKWLEAMRSGQYRMDPSMLRMDDDVFSATGLLLHVIDPGGWERHPRYGYWLWRGDTHFPPTDVREQIGWTMAFQYRVRVLAEACGTFPALADRLHELVESDAPPVTVKPPEKPKRGHGRKK